MNDLLAKIIARKGQDEDMDPDYRDSKLAVLQHLKDEMSKLMAGDLQGGMKKVTVAAPDQAGLKDGLAKAQDLMGKDTHLDDDSLETDDDELEEDGEHEHEADDDSLEGEHSADSLDAMSPEEMKALLKQLMAAKQG